MIHVSAPEHIHIRAMPTGKYSREAGRKLLTSAFKDQLCTLRQSLSHIKWQDRNKVVLAHLDHIWASLPHDERRRYIDEGQVPSTCWLPFRDSASSSAAAAEADAEVVWAAASDGVHDVCVGSVSSGGVSASS